MMAIIFCILLLATIFAWTGVRRIALPLFAITLLLGIAWFLHHVTSHLAIQV